MEELHRTVLLSMLLCIICTQEASGYCWAAGRNPGFSGPPRIEQLKIDVVRVSWENIVSMRECADNFVVKYWPRSAPNQYEITELVATSENSVDITVIPKIYYQFQAVAREDKGVIGGVDWNKSPTVDFRTSSSGNQVFDGNVSPEMIESIVGEGGADASVNTNYEERNMLVMGLSVEVFVGIVVISLIVVLVLIGMVYKIVAGKRKVTDVEDDLEKSNAEVDDNDENEDDNDDDDNDGEDFDEKTSTSLQMEKEEMAPEKNAP